MRRLLLTITALLALSGTAAAQATHLITSGTLPTYCTVGDAYVKTGTSTGIYGCFATDTWTRVATVTLGVADGGTGLASGTSGGVLYFSGSTTIASSAALTVNLPVIGGGAGSPPTVGTRSGNTTTFATTTGTLTSTHCVNIDASGNLTDSGATCGGSGTVSTTGSPVSGDIAKFSGSTSITTAAVTGTGSVVLASSPTLTTPTLGVAAATSVAVNGSLTTNAKISIAGQATSPFVDDGNSGTADTIDWSTGNVHYSTLTGSPTYTFSNPADGGRLVLVLAQDGTGSRTVTWPGTVLWPSGTAPTLTTTASKADICTFIYNATTAKYYGACSLNY